MISMKPFFGWLAYRNISLKELSEKSGIGYPTLLNMRKNNSFTVRNLDKICTTLNGNIKDIMRYEG
jgi:DNA-binding Xre family transcriptional regulator